MDRVQTRRKLSAKERDYLLLTAFVFVRHGYAMRARHLVESLLALGEVGQSILLKHAVLRFLEKDYAGALKQLDQLEVSASRQALSGRQTAQSNIHRYLRARCYCETGRQAEGQAIARALAVS